MSQSLKETRCWQRDVMPVFPAGGAAVAGVLSATNTHFKTIINREQLKALCQSLEYIEW